MHTSARARLTSVAIRIPILKISCKSVWKFLRKVANKQTNNDNYISSLAEVNIPPHLKCITTLPCGMFVLKNCNDPELSEANFHAILSHSKQLLKNIHPMTLASFCSLTKWYLQRPHRKTHRMTDFTYICLPRKKMLWQNVWAHN